MQASTPSPTKANFEIQDHICDLSSGQSLYKLLQPVYAAITASAYVAFSLYKCKVAVHILPVKPTKDTGANTIFFSNQAAPQEPCSATE